MAFDCTLHLVRAPVLSTEESILEKGLFSVYLELNGLFSENLNNPDVWRKMAYKKTSGLFRNDMSRQYKIRVK